MRLTTRLHSIVSGFHSAGIHPFAPNIIVDKFPKPKDNSALSQASISEHLTSTGKTNGKADVTEKTNDKADITSLTPETLKLYEKRIENGYDVYTDLNYVAWFEKFYPDHLPPLGMLMFVAISALLLCEIYAYELLLNFVYIDVLLGNTEQRDVPDIQQQHIQKPGTANILPCTTITYSVMITVLNSFKHKHTSNESGSQD